MVSHNFKEDRTDDVVLDKDYTFEKMLLPEEILKGTFPLTPMQICINVMTILILTVSGLTEAGFIYPSMIQKKGIPIGRCGYGRIILYVNYHLLIKSLCRFTRPIEIRNGQDACL